jgi:hypothetical protein
MFASALNRARRQTAAALIAVGLVATLGVDIAQAASGGSGPSAATQQRAYLERLRPIAVRVHDAVSPIEHMMSRIVEPHFGDAYAARDALIYGGSLAAVESALADLRKITAPVGLVSQQRQLVAAASAMHEALGDAPDLALLDDVDLSYAVNGYGVGPLAVNAVKWQVALEAAFKGRAAVPPGLHTTGNRAPASRTEWIFGADRSCMRAVLMLTPASRRVVADNRTPATLQDYWEHWRHTIDWFGGKLAALPNPAGADALPKQFVAHLKALPFDAAVAARLKTALARGDQDRVLRAFDQLSQIRAGLRLLGADFKRYGARICGTAVSSFAGVREDRPAHAHPSA